MSIASQLVEGNNRHPLCAEHCGRDPARRNGNCWNVNLTSDPALGSSRSSCGPKAGNLAGAPVRSVGE